METFLRTTLALTLALTRPVQRLLRWCYQWHTATLKHPRIFQPHTHWSKALYLQAPAPQPTRHWQGPVRTPPTPAPTGPIRHLPLRRHTHSNGKIAISGRMADVCAELERLAANENRYGKRA